MTAKADALAAIESARLAAVALGVALADANDAKDAADAALAAATEQYQADLDAIGAAIIAATP